MNRMIVFMAAAILSVTACSASRPAGVAHLDSTAAGGVPASHSPAPSGALAFSECMRSSGVPQFPDPDNSGALPKIAPQQVGVSDVQFGAAQRECAHLLQPSTTQSQQTLDGMRDFARCMRSHGVHDWPDPTTDGSGQPVFDLHGQIDPDSEQLVASSGECSRLLQPAPGQNGTVLCDGIGEAGCHHYG